MGYLSIACCRLVLTWFVEISLEVCREQVPDDSPVVVLPLPCTASDHRGTVASGPGTGRSTSTQSRNQPAAAAAQA